MSKNEINAENPHLKAILAKIHNRNQQYNKQECLDQAPYLYDLGWDLIPVNGKQPYLKEWQKNPRLPLYKLESHICENYATGYGLRLGQQPNQDIYIAFDCDGTSGSHIYAELFEDEKPDTVSWTSGKTGRDESLFTIPSAYKEHFVNYGTKRVTAYKDIQTKEGEALEIRGKGSQVVLPPSKHPETGKYNWINNPYETPIAELPESTCDKLLELARKKNQKSRKEYKQEVANKISNYTGSHFYGKKSPVHRLIDAIEKKVTFDDVFDWYGHHFHHKNDHTVQGYCPKHGGESGTAFQVDTENLLWYCHGCGVGGGILQYVCFVKFGHTNVSGKVFWTILQELAEKVGINVNDYLENGIVNNNKFTADETINVRHLSEAKLEFNNDENYAIKSTLGSGKTTWMKKIIQSNENKILFTSFRDSITQNLVANCLEQNAEIIHVNDAERPTDLLSVPSIGTNADSIYKISYSKKFDYLVIDEAEGFLKHLIYGETDIKKRRKAVIDRLITAAKNAKHILLLDAFLTDKTVAYYEKLFGVKITKVENKHKNKLRQINIIKTEKEIDHLINEKLAQKERLFILLDSTEKAKQLETKLKEHGNTLCVTSETKDRYSDFLFNPTQYIADNKIDYLIATSCIGVGFSIENYNYFDAVIGRFLAGVYDAQGIGQFLFRLRDFDVPRYICLGNRRLQLNPKKIDEVWQSISDNEDLTEDEKQSIRNQIDEDQKSIIQEGLELFIDREQMEKINYQKAILTLLEGYYEKIDFVKIENAESCRKEYKKLDEKLKTDKAQNILESDDKTFESEPDKTFFQYRKKDNPAWRKQLYKRLIPGIDKTDLWNEENVKLLENDYYKKVKAYYDFIHFDTSFKAKQTKKARNLLIERCLFYYDYDNEKESYLRVCKDIELTKLIERGYYIENGDELIADIEESLDNHELNYKIYGKRKPKSFSSVINKMLKNLGFYVSRTRVRNRNAYRFKKPKLFEYIYSCLLDADSCCEANLSSDSAQQYKNNNAQSELNNKRVIKGTNPNQDFVQSVASDLDHITHNEHVLATKYGIKNTALIETICDEIAKAEANTELEIDHDGTHWVTLDAEKRIVDYFDDDF